MKPKDRSSLIIFPTNCSSFVHYHTFHSLWFLFVLIHLTLSMRKWEIVGVGFLNSGNEMIRLLSILAVPGSLLAIFYPLKRWLTLAVLTVWSTTKLEALPVVPNHIILALAVNVLLASVVFSSYQKEGNVRNALGGAFLTWLPVGRGLLLILYFWTIFHKLNSDFFHPEVSCAAELYHQIADRFPLLPLSRTTDWATIVITFTIELALPILFAMTRFVPYGILVGVPFHLILATHPNEYILSFTAEIFALYSLFLSPSMLRRFQRYFHWAVGQLPNAFQQFWKVKSQILFIIFGVLWILMNATVGFPNRYLQIVWWGNFLFVTSVAFVLVLSAWKCPVRSEAKDLRVSAIPRLGLCMLVLVFANGALMYTGLKTATTFSMFSNLRVQPEQSNHFFVPAKFVTPTFLGDTVIILETDDPGLAKILESEESMPFFELRRYLYERRNRSLSVTFERAGKLESLTLPADQHHVAVDPPPWWLRKLILFRNLPKPGPCPCQW